MIHFNKLPEPVEFMLNNGTQFLNNGQNAIGKDFESKGDLSNFINNDF